MPCCEVPGPSAAALFWLGVSPFAVIVGAAIAGSY